MHLSFRMGAFALLLYLTASCGTVPKTSLDSQPDGAPRAWINDTIWGQVLNNCFAENGAIRLTALESDTDLTNYLSEIALVQPDALNSRSDQLAFWINTHNAYVLDIIRSNPARSIDDISGFRYAKVIHIAGQLYSLDDIEHTIVEQHFREPRAFFALYDGSRSSPAIGHEPYSGSALSNQLNDQLRGFLADSTKNYLDRRSNTVYLSKIFADYKSTLEEMAGEPLSSVVRDFGPPALSEWMSRHSNVQISYLRYDYTIDETDLPITHEPTNPRKYTPPRRASGGIR